MTTELLFIHGSGYTAESFAAQCEAFPGSSALRLPGHPTGVALPSVSAAARWLAHEREERPNQGAIVAGNSLGGAIAMRWALDFPQQAKAIIVIGSGARLRVAPRILSMIENDWPACIPALVELALSKNATQELRARATLWHEQVGRENTLRDYMACNAFDIMQEVRQLRVPTLVVVGSEDRMTPPKYAKYLHAAIPGSRLLVIEGAGHLTMAEKAEQVNSAIHAFLRALS